jgi:hypothetical protein
MDNKIVNIIDTVPFVGEDGLDYIRVTKEILTPRKTYLKGTVLGKYRGDKLPDENDKSDLFDFEIYEAEVTCTSKEDVRKNKPFNFPKDFKNIEGQNKIKGTIFPKEKLPQTLPVIIKSDDKSFGINLLEPQLFEFDIVRKFHQIEGDEVYGTFNAFVTGYVFDYEREEIEEIKKIEIIDIDDDGGGGIIIDPIHESNGIKTGKEEKKDGYIRYEYFCKHHPDTLWGPWEIIPGKDGCSYGCLSQILAIIALLIGLYFVIKLFPFLLIFVGFYILIVLIGIFAPYLKWIFRILCILLLITFFGSVFKTCSSSSSHYNPNPLVIDTPREINPPVIVPVTPVDTNQIDTIQKPIKDSIITRYRSWKDYSGKSYEGKYQIRLSSFKKAHYNKNSLNISQNTIKSYDGIVFNLKEFDKNNINSVFRLFDSIGKANKLNKIKFAEMIVTFVQDIPYAIVLQDGCDASLYNDQFTRNYLLNHTGECDGGQRFGINTPIEFLVNLKGDCDTRTLLLYTIFSYYNYDVALMSSEFYGHSIIGINLPIAGMAYTYGNQRYVMWETTAPNCKAGVIPNEISNLNNWRISLKSK